MMKLNIKKGAKQILPAPHCVTLESNGLFRFQYRNVVRQAIFI